MPDSCVARKGCQGGAAILSCRPEVIGDFAQVLHDTSPRLRLIAHQYIPTRRTESQQRPLRCSRTARTALLLRKPPRTNGGPDSHLYLPNWPRHGAHYALSRHRLLRVEAHAVAEDICGETHNS